VSERALVVGATSGIGRAIARQLASEGTALVLAGRRLQDLEKLAKDIEVRFGTAAEVMAFEATAFDTHAELFPEGQMGASGASPALDGLVLCYGVMPDQADAERDFALAREMIDVNYTSAVSVLSLAAAYFEERGRGWICAIGSVAGDRGRPGNYLYGSTKAALATCLQGLRARLAKSGVSVTTVKPGVVDTAMTWGLPGLPLAAAPERVARDAVRAIRKGRAVIYTPWFWGGIMAVIRSIPVRIFDRLDL